ncbi:hypothetical protein DPMN_057203 [Dreissena polymorpha]|uniref:Rapamycin-insensitive companion of mTOR domain-containing protein n=1 Tax=Dreissena polymorpha TaxID=45954 RepID=A0A9D4CW18_DREPO|nr:hypothetical protein DPMN_057203 [Dreissena polymorpha]
MYTYFQILVKRHIFSKSKGPQPHSQKGEKTLLYIYRTAFFVLGLVSSTREGAELLSQYGWESRWNNRSERWPLVEDHTVLLDDALDEAQTEACFQHSHSRLELNSPSSLDFIVEERFKMKIGNSDRPNGGVGEAENVDEESDCESGIQMLVKPKGPGNYSPDLRSLRGRLKSSSMYQTGSGSKSYMLPPRSQTFRGASRGVEIKGRTQSVEHLSASTGDLLSISSERPERSLSANIPVDGSSSDIGDHATVAANNNVDSSFNKQYVKDETGNLSPETVEHFSEDKTSVVKFTGVINFNQQHIEKNLIQKEHILNDVVPVSLNECDQIINHQHYSESDIQISVTDSENQVIEQMSDSRTPDGHIETTRSEPLENSSFKMAYPVDIEQGSKSLPTENSVRKSAVSLIREKSNGSDSSQTTNSTKSRTDSFNTDSTTSGVGSYDSGLHGVVEGMSSLSPIPSSHSLENLEHFEVEMRRKDKPELQERMHHSVIMRKISHLSRVPSFRRQSSPSAGIATSFDYSDNAIMYTTARDAMGYATLRNLRNARQISMDNESDMGLNMLYGSSTSLNRRPSIDSTYKQRPTRWTNIYTIYVNWQAFLLCKGKFEILV